MRMSITMFIPMSIIMETRYTFMNMNMCTAMNMFMMILLKGLWKTMMYLEMKNLTSMARTIITIKNMKMNLTTMNISDFKG